MLPPRRSWFVLAVLCGVLAVTSRATPAAPEGKTTTLRFEVTIAPGLVTTPAASGRLLVVLGEGGQPRNTIGHTGMDAPPVFGADVDAFTDKTAGVIDGKSASFPL